MTIETPPTPELELSGYDTEDRYLATRYMQGGRVVYTVDLSVPQLTSTLPKPDATRPLKENRLINHAHAKRFATYVRKQERWVVPPLLLRAPTGIFEFEQMKKIGGTEWGVLTIPRLARDELAIVDGQHRVLGFHLAVQDLSEELREARGQFASAKKLGDAAVTREAQSRVQALEDERQRLSEERVSIQIIIVDDPEEFRQVFVDIADNAKGITRTTVALFDTRKIVNRCLDQLMDHPLLKDRVDLYRDRILGENQNLMGVKQLADVIRTLQVGVSGRISHRQEKELAEEDIISHTKEFLDVLVAAFPDFARIVDGSLDVADLRKTSLLGSVGIHRVLAAAYHGLVSSDSKTAKLTRLQVQRYFERLSPFMDAPVTNSGPWVKVTGLFVEGGMAPITSSAGDLKKLTAYLVRWALSEPAWMSKTPKSTRSAPAEGSD